MRHIQRVMSIKSVLAASLLLGSILALGYYLWLKPQPAPDIELASIDGTRIRLSTLKAHPVLVSFWASDCRSCREELPDLLSLYQEFAPQGFRLLTVAMAYDPPSRVVALAREQQWPYTVILDPSGTAAQAFGQVSLIPHHFLIDAQGNIRMDTVGKLNRDALHTYINALIEEN
ncbi:MAG: TlpA disulfide reductase family protein [Methylococcaceae bacterium]